MEKETLVRVVKAARWSARLAEIMQGLIADGGGADTLADLICGSLFDALHRLSGEKLSIDDDFKDAPVTQLLLSQMSDGEVTDEILRMSTENAEKTEMPAPCGMNAGEMFEKNGGYSAQHGYKAPDDDRLLKAMEIIADCRNDLCNRCGAFKHEYLGACDQCRWHNLFSGGDG